MRTTAALRPWLFVVCLLLPCPAGAEETLQAEPPNPFGFTGHRLDPETGLYYMKGRFYDPQTGRFLSSDPFKGDVDDPPSLHRFSYAHDNPTVYTDPSGTRVATEEDRARLAGLARTEALLRREYAVSRSFLGSSITAEQYEHAMLDIRTQQQTFISAVADAEDGQPVIDFRGHASFFDTRSVTRFAAVPTRERWERETAANARILAVTVEGPNVVAGLLSGRVARPLATKPSRAAAMLGDASRAGSQPGAMVVRESTSGPSVALVPLDAPPGFVRSPGSAAISGETASTRTGKVAHATSTEFRRQAGLFDAINQPITTAKGEPILVPHRVDLRTGVAPPGAKLQEAIPDAVMYGRGIIVDDKPLGRPLAKDRQEIIRFITAYQTRMGKLPERIAIPRYDPRSGDFVRTDLHRPDEFLPKQ